MKIPRMIFGGLLIALGILFIWVLRLLLFVLLCFWVVAGFLDGGILGGLLSILFGGIGCAIGFFLFGWIGGSWQWLEQQFGQVRSTSNSVIYVLNVMTGNLAGWKYICDYHGQNPGYAELDDPDMPVSVRIYGRGNRRKAVSKTTGEVEFEYEYAPGAIERMKYNIAGDICYFKKGK